jgi:hypothetical protein
LPPYACLHSAKGEKTSQWSVIVQQGRGCAEEVCETVLVVLREQADDKADAVLLNDYYA